MITPMTSHTQALKNFRRALMLGAAIGLALPLAPALAQTAPGQTAQAQAAAAPSSQIEEIVVTAQKRSENLQNVPIAVTALTASALANQGIDSATDLAQAVPGLQFNTQVGGYAQPFIRGVGTTGTGPGIENPVATYIDGVYYGAASSALFAMNDVEQVAVLKGPQGTLFGRNATGGLIQVTTRSPSFDFSGDIDGTIGDHETLGTNVFLTGGLTDTIAASVDLHLDNQNEGFGKNLATGEDVQTHKSYATRDKILFQPDDSTKVTLSFDYSQLRASDPAIRTIGKTYLGDVTPGGPWDIDLDTQPQLDSRQYGTSLTAQHDFGGLQLVSITGYRNSYLMTYFDGDQTPLDFVRVRITQKDEQISQEFQLLSPSDQPLQWMVGGLYYWSSDSYSPVTTSITAIPGSMVLTTTDDLTSYAVFGQATYKFEEGTSVTGGLRYTTDERTVVADEVLDAFGAVIPQVMPVNESKNFDKLTWRLAVDHRFTPELLGYISYNRGFKSGTFAPQTFPVVSLKPETLDAYEIGLKSDLLDKRVRLDVAGYYYDYTNIQVTQIVNNLQTVFDGQGATSYGIDMDLTAKATDRLSFNAGLGWIHGRYGTFTDCYQTTPAGFGGNLVSTTGNCSGKQLQDMPDVTFNIGAVYVQPTDFGDLNLATSYYFNDGWFSEPENRLFQPSYGVLDASITWISPNGRFDVRFWGKNLTDQIYAQQLNAVDSGDNRVAAPGRTLGITAGIHF